MIGSTVIDMYFPLASYDGYCASCDAEQPLVLVEHGPRGLRAWLAGIGPEDRTLSYCCLVCGRNEHVPLTEEEDAEYDATLARWPDTFLEPVVVLPEPLVVPAGDVFAAAAVRLQEPVVLPEPVVPRKPVVTVITLPTQRVAATDLVAVA